METYVTGGGHIPHKSQVVDIVDVSVLHEAQVLVPHHLLYAGRHLVGEDPSLVALVHEFGELHQAVLSAGGASTGTDVGGV